MIFRRLFIAICVLISQVGIAQVRSVSLRDLLSAGFKNNYNIQLESLGVRKSEFTIMKAEGLLNPFLESNAGYGSGVDPTITYNGTQYGQTNLVVPTRWGINFYTGGRVERSFLIQDDFTLNSAGAWVGFSMPLLRGLGTNSEVNTFIKTSDLNNKALNEELSNEVIVYFSDMMSAFLNLKKQSVNANIANQAYVEAMKYSADIHQLSSNDLIPRVENNRAEALVSQRKQELLDAVLKGVNAYYDVQQLTGISIEAVIDTLPQILDLFPAPNVEQIQNYISSRSPILDTLISGTPQYKNISYRIEENRQVLANARNQKLNPLDLDVRVSRFGMIKNGPYNFTNSVNSPYPGTSVMITLSHKFPITNRQQRGAYLEQMTELETTATFREQYVFEAKLNATRLLNTLHQLTVLYQQSEIVANAMEQTYRAEKEKFNYGDATQIDVVLSFNNYFDAQTALNNLKYELYSTYVELRLLLGELPRNQQELSSFNVMEFFSKAN